MNNMLFRFIRLLANCIISFNCVLTFLAGVEMKSGKELVDFLADKSAMDIVNRFGYGFNPVVDGLFMPQTPISLHDAGKFHPVDILLGFNTDEGFSFIKNLLLEEKREMSPDLASDILKLIVFKQ